MMTTGARRLVRIVGGLSALLGALGVAAVGTLVLNLGAHLLRTDFRLTTALSAATLAAGVGLWRGARWSSPLALAVWGAQVVTVDVGAWAWRWTLGPYVHLRLGPGGARGAAWGFGLDGPWDGATDYVALNVVALVVVTLLAAALHRARRTDGGAPPTSLA